MECKEQDLSKTETIHLRLGLESIWLGLELGQNPAWDLNSQGWDLKLAKINSLPTEITLLFSGLKEAQVLDVSS